MKWQNAETTINDCPNRRCLARFAPIARRLAAKFVFVGAMCTDMHPPAVALNTSQTLLAALRALSIECGTQTHQIGSIFLEPNERTAVWVWCDLCVCFASIWFRGLLISVDFSSHWVRFSADWDFYVDVGKALGVQLESPVYRRCSHPIGILDRTMVNRRMDLDRPFHLTVRWAEK